VKAHAEKRYRSAMRQAKGARSALYDALLSCHPLVRHPEGDIADVGRQAEDAALLAKEHAAMCKRVNALESGLRAIFKRRDQEALPLEPPKAEENVA
jgi:hypothetical protein